MSKTTKNKPLVSLLIPTYNRVEFLGSALDSALAQTYPNLEIIVHDDHSTDGTGKLLSRYHDPRLRIIKTSTNHGMIGGWNYIVKRARGEYIKFLASDDLLESNCVSSLVLAALANPDAAIITCRRKFVGSSGQVIKTMGFAKHDQVESGVRHAHWILTNLRENKIGEPTAVLYPTKLVKLAGEYDPVFSQFADFEYWIRLLAYGQLVYIDQPLCSFRVHEGSNTSRAISDGRFISEIFALIRKYYDNPEYVKKFNLTLSDRHHVTNQKTLDTLKNIKDLFVSGQLAMARRYFGQLSSQVTLDHMTRSTVSFLLKK